MALTKNWFHMTVVHGTPQQLRIGLAWIAVLCVLVQIHSIWKFDCPNCQTVEKGPTRFMTTTTTKSSTSLLQEDTYNPFAAVQVQDDDNIRTWGCIPRNESPFIFVHIGKVRSMFVFVCALGDRFGHGFGP